MKTQLLGFTLLICRFGSHLLGETSGNPVHPAFQKHQGPAPGRPLLQYPAPPSSCEAPFPPPGPGIHCSPDDALPPTSLCAQAAEDFSPAVHLSHPEQGPQSCSWSSPCLSGLGTQNTFALLPGSWEHKEHVVCDFGSFRPSERTQHRAGWSERFSEQQTWPSSLPFRSPLFLSVFLFLSLHFLLAPSFSLIRRLTLEKQIQEEKI